MKASKSGQHPLKGLIAVSRPPLLLLGVIAPVSLLSWSGSLFTAEAALITLSIALANWSWVLKNELNDIVIDRINKPHKPLPAGLVSKRCVEALTAGTLIASLIPLSYLVILKPLYTIGFLAHITAAVYNLGRRDVLGNICLAATYCLAAFISTYPKHLWFPPAFALLTFAHNVVVQYQDTPAELKAGRITAPIQLGRWRSTLAVAAAGSAASLLFLYFDAAIGILLLAAASLITAASSILIAKQTTTLIEALNRKAVRLLILTGFLILLAETFLT